MSRTRKLDPIEIRVLGALLEKEQTTPDQYPLTINAAIAACNQKTNREPVTHLNETEVVEALDRLRDDVLVWRTQTSRSERWQHSLDRRWSLNKKSKAIMTLLLLRGPQTVAELRTRSDRMANFESIEDVEETLLALSTGFDALVCELPRRPGQRETRWMHLESTAGDPRELDAAEAARQGLEASASDTAPGEATARPSRRGQADERLERLEGAVAGLEEQVGTLHEQLANLTQKLVALSKELGYED